MSSDSHSEVKVLSFNFESLGHNCEFGFALRKLGNEEGQLLRWAVVPIEAITRLIKDAPASVFELKDLVPVDHDMVRDTATGISFHCLSRYERSGSDWVEVTQSVSADELYSKDRVKFAYMYSKFQDRLKNKRSIFVYKYAVKPDMVKIAELHQVILEVSGGKSFLAVVHEDKNLSQKIKFDIVYPGLIVCAMQSLVDNKFSNSNNYSIWHQFIRMASFECGFEVSRDFHLST